MARVPTSDLEIKEISENIRKALKYSHLTQKELSEKTEIRLETLRSYIKARRCPSLENAQKIGEITGVNYVDFLSTEQKKHLKALEKGTFIEKNKVYVPLLRSVGYDFDAAADNELEIKCRLTPRKEKILREKCETVRQQLLESLKNPDDRETIEKKISEYTMFKNMIPSPVKLSSREWDSLKTEISDSVKQTIEKFMAEKRKERNTQTIRADLLKTLTAVNSVLPQLDASGAVDRELLETLKDISRRYAYLPLYERLNSD